MRSLASLYLLATCLFEETLFVQKKSSSAEMVRESKLTSCTVLRS